MSVNCSEEGGMYMLLQKVFYNPFHKEDMKVSHLLIRAGHFYQHTKHHISIPLATVSSSVFTQDGF